MCFSNLPGRSRVGVVVVVRVEDNHLPRRGVRVQLMVGIDASRGGGIGAR